MKIDFSNQWYREQCNEAGWNPDNVLSLSAVEVAKKRSVDMKMYMDALKKYEDEKLQADIQRQINRLNNQRIEFMLNALFYAEVMHGLGEEYNMLLENHIRKHEALIKGR